MPVEVLEAIKEAQGTEDELASIKAYLDSGADKEAPLGNFNFFSRYKFLTFSGARIELLSKVFLCLNPHWERKSNPGLTLGRESRTPT